MALLSVEAVKHGIIKLDKLRGDVVGDQAERMPCASTRVYADLM